MRHRCAGASWFDSNLESTAAVHLVESSLVLLELEDVGDHALDIDCATIEVGDCTREAEGLRERAEDLESFRFVRRDMVRKSGDRP